MVDDIHNGAIRDDGRPTAKSFAAPSHRRIHKRLVALDDRLKLTWDYELRNSIHREMTEIRQKIALDGTSK